MSNKQLLVASGKLELYKDGKVTRGAAYLGYFEADTDNPAFHISGEIMYLRADDITGMDLLKRYWLLHVRKQDGGE